MKLLRINLYFLATVFMFSGTIKLIDPSDFARTMADIEWVPSSVGNAMVYAVPLFEVFCAVGLVSPWWRWRRICVLGAAMLTIAFLSFWIHALVVGRDMPCSCFGNIEWLSFGGNLGGFLRALVFFCAALHGYYWMAHATATGLYCGSSPSPNCSNGSSVPERI